MPDTSREDLLRFRNVAEAIVRETRAVVLAALGREIPHRLKADGSFVTDVDLHVEDLVRSRLAATFPEHGILGEERAGPTGTAEYLWVVDPIDGTHSLRHRIPLFGTILALRRGGRSILGVIDLPMLDRTYVGVEGFGAYRNGERVELTDVQAPEDIAREVIATGERRQFVGAGREDAFDRLMRAHGSVRTYCDCFGHALAIEGAVGAMVDFNLRLWDVAATEVLIREAGGVFEHVAMRGSSAPAEEMHDVVFGKPGVVAWVRGILGATA
jgi:fructose-1,6-bisphosphatase/inositol monophosphatase family enzyme